jgi:hypothetical protein
VEGEVFEEGAGDFQRQDAGTQKLERLRRKNERLIYKVGELSIFGRFWGRTVCP